MLDQGFNDDGVFIDDATGFKVAFYKQDQTNEYVIAFAGTEDSKDWFTDLQLGLFQWSGNSSVVIDYLVSIKTRYSDANINFTGHSLGGALAQYAAYDYIKKHQETDAISDRPINTTLTTVNALGGIDGLKQAYNQDYSASIANELGETRHYILEGDLVSSLGGGHLGGNTYLIKNQLLPNPMDFMEGHYLATVMGLPPSFIDAATPVVLDYFDLEVLQPLAGSLSNLFNDKDVSQLEANMRLVVGILGAATVYEKLSVTSLEYGELEKLLNRFIENIYLSDPDSTTGMACKILMTMPWEGLFRSLIVDEGATATGITGMALLGAVLCDKLEVGMETLRENLPQNMIDELEKTEFFQSFDVIRDFVVEFNTTVSDITDRLTGYFIANDKPLPTLNDMALSEGGQATMTLSLNREAGSKGEIYLLTVYDPDLITLSGDGVFVRDATTGQYLVSIEPESTSRNIQVNANGNDGNNTFDSAMISVAGTPYTELGDMFSDQVFDTAYIDIDDTHYDSSQALHQYGTNNDGVASSNTRDVLTYVYALGGNDIVYNSGELSQTYGGDGNDHIETSSNLDTFDGSTLDEIANYFLENTAYATTYTAAMALAIESRDQRAAGLFNDWSDGGAGNDQLYGYDGEDYLAGGDGKDYLNGGGGNDILIAGGATENLLVGHAHSDTLIGGQGTDYLIGDADIQPGDNSQAGYLEWSVTN
ncbi:MAG: DUF2974 domain-containing protein, partial [Candidatus Thiodiazotropha sp. (ex Monitilora ramsayi)]|nr:DUF2974 domain-containing protein [Candidatus Thiodiazotropha sp. (ex Monitilora ramsayi)]